MTGLPVNRAGGIVFGQPVVSVRVVSCTATKLPRIPAETLASATAFLCGTAARQDEYRASREAAAEMFAVPKSKRGVPYWNGESFNDGCFWITNGGGRAERG